MKIGLVTCQALPEADEDAPILLDALRRRGQEPDWVAWDDPSVDLGWFDLAIIRSTWNYYFHPEAFMAWLSIASRSTQLLNPLPVITWNLHKGYLGILDKKSIPIVPTSWFKRASRPSFHDILNQNGWSAAVIKPSISAASYKTQRFDRSQVAEGQRFLEHLCSERDVMVQEYMPSVEGYGERSIVWIDGQVTHAIRKNARFHDGTEHVSEAVVPLEDERSFADKTIQSLGFDLLYARVDIMRDQQDRIRLSELELIEPSLFLTQHPPALEHFADAIVRRGAKGRRE